MPSKRHESVPPISQSQRPSSSTPDSSTVVDTSSSQLPWTLKSRVDAIAKLQWEMNLRSMSFKVAHLEKDLKALVESTQNDQRFRDQHEGRIKELWKEMLVVSGHASKVSEETVDLRSCQQKLQSELYDTIGGMKSEVSDMRDELNAIRQLLDQLPSQQELDEEFGKGSFGTQDSGLGSQEKEIPENHNSAPQGSSSQPAVAQRIKQTIDSTRRWNREFKVSKLSEPQFIATYFRKQSRRDPRVAVYLQRNVQKRVRAKSGTFSHSQPRSMEEFCQHVKWKDVLDTADEVFGKHRESAEKDLSQ